MRNFLFTPNASARLNFSLGFLSGLEKENQPQQAQLLGLSSRSAQVPANGTLHANDDEIDLMVEALDKTGENSPVTITVWEDLRDNIRAQAAAQGMAQQAMIGSTHAIGAGATNADTGTLARAG